MKLSKIGLIVITLFAAKDAAAVEVFISGTTAMRDLLPLVMNKICQSASAATPRGMYEAAPSISGSRGKVASNSATILIEDPDRRAFKCHTHSATTNSTVATALGVNADKDLTVYMSSEYGDSDSSNGNNGPLDNLLGGSITGIAPLAPYLSPATKQATVRFIDTSGGCSLNANLDVALGTANGNNALGVPVKGYGFVGATKYTCSNQIQSHASDIGVSEMEPSKFDVVYQNLPSTVDTSVVPDEWQNFDVSVFTQGGMVGKPANTKTAFVSTYGIVAQDVVPASLVANLNQVQLANILAGFVTNWKLVGGPDLPIKICTRPAGNGIKAVFNQLVSRAGCAANSYGFEYSVATADSVLYNGYRSNYLDNKGSGIRENLTTKDLQACMTDNQWATGELTLAGGGSAANTGALGFIGLDSIPTITTNAGYHFIGFNGTNPVDITKATDTVDGLADGVRKDLLAMGYPLWLESTVQVSPSVTDANKLAFFNYLAKHAGDTEFTNMLPSLLALDDGRAGFIGVNGVGHTPSRGDIYYYRGGDTCNADQLQ